MKVRYTLPGLIPPPAPAAPELERRAETFRMRLRQLRAPDRGDWRRLLRLDTPPANGAAIGPPPTPPGMEPRDAVTRRAYWRSRLEFHAQNLDRWSGPPATGPEAEERSAVRRSVALLLKLQQLEDAVIARHLSETGM